MHSNPVSNSDGTFKAPIIAKRKCSKCGSQMTVEVWESSCGGYEDEFFACTNDKCKHSYWVDGGDS